MSRPESRPAYAITFEQAFHNSEDVLWNEAGCTSELDYTEFLHLYEAKIQRMGDAGRNGGEYYTPRPLFGAMVRVVRPQIGGRIYGGACGSAGFFVRGV